jgi:hypothetical protein
VREECPVAASLAWKKKAPNRGFRGNALWDENRAFSGPTTVQLFLWIRLPLDGQGRAVAMGVTVDGIETVIVGDMISGAPY